MTMRRTRKGKARTRAKLAALRRSLDWQSSGHFVTGVESGERMLALAILPQNGDWTAIAIETSRQYKSLVGVLEDHGHKIIGVYRVPHEAFQAAEKFAEVWKLARIERAWQCACRTIDRGKKWVAK